MATARKRGPVSAASLMFAAATKPLEIALRPPAPHDLTDEEVEIWSDVVSAQPADYFSAANTPLLSQFCRHVIHARRIAELIEQATCDSELKITD